MKRIVLAGALAILGPWAAAQNSNVLTLSQFLDEVKTKNPGARAAIANAESLELRSSEAELPIMTELYGSYTKFDDKKPQAQPIFMGQETKGDVWRAGLRKQTEYGLAADLYFNAQRTDIEGASPQFLNVPNYMESQWVLQLKQSLWRNGFGESTRANIEANRSEMDASLYKSRFDLKNLLLNAENAYWSVVTYNEVVKLQQENVERARKLRDYMNGRAKSRLFDDTDALQAQVNFESRELDLQKSLDDRAVLIRQLNTFRGVDSDDVMALEPLPAKSVMAETKSTPSGHMTREDFDQIRAQAKMGVARAAYAQSQIRPQLDLVGSVATNGRDGVTSQSYYQAGTDRYPTWSIGLNFSIPIDYTLIGKIGKGYRKAKDSADAATQQAEFNETRLWDDLVRRKKEALGRYERSQSVEKITTDLVKRERTRMLNGRATTYEALDFEQKLALAQIQRAEAQLDLITLHNAIKTFEARK